MTIGRQMPLNSSGFGTNHNENISSKSHSLAASTKKVEVSRDISWILRTGSKRALFIALKTHLSAVIHRREELEFSSYKWMFIELAIVHLTHLRDIPFMTKYEKEITSLYSIYLVIKDINKKNDRIQWVDPELLFIVTEFPLALFHLRTLPQLEEIFNVKRFLKRVNRNLQKYPPRPRFIGVGYKDYGDRRDPSYDGSPSWQEVASSLPPETSSTKRRSLFIDDLDLSDCIPELRFHARREMQRGT